MFHKINSVAVLGSGLMGSSLACFLAGAGFQVILLDLAAKEGNPKAGVDRALQQALNQKPSPIYHRKFASRIQTGTFENDLHRISDSDWILEAVVERIEVKRSLFEQVERYRKPGTPVTTNTSGIPVCALTEGRSEDFKSCFLGTHFFNPPRYLKLLEIIPTRDTREEWVLFFMHFGKSFLGKQTVRCKDTPAFLANRIGVVSMSKIFEWTAELGLSVSEADKLTGTALGRPSTGSFRLADYVGVDTAVAVLEGLQNQCVEDAMVQEVKFIPALRFLLDQNWYGLKSGRGFYEKTERENGSGKPIIQELNLSTFLYEPQKESSMESIKLSRQISELGPRIKALIKGSDAGSILVRRSLGFLLAYAGQRIPESADSIYAIDQAMRSGYVWELGPFETWDLLGFESGMELIRECGASPALWLEDMQAAGYRHFYTMEAQRTQYYDIRSRRYELLPGQEDEFHFYLCRGKTAVYQNPEMILHDIGDGVLGLEIISENNVIGEGILRGIQQSIQIAEEQHWNGLVIGSDARQFTVGANLMLIGMMAFQQQYDQLDLAVRLFQETSMRCRYSAIPVVAATQGYVFGGGVELLMHADAAVCAVESYLGFVEVAVGLLPGGAGTKEFAVRLSDSWKAGELQTPQLIERFRTIATAAVSTSAFEAFDLGYLDPRRDKISISDRSHILQAKSKVLQLAENYIRPVPRTDVQVLGKTGLAALYAAAYSMRLGDYASEHDLLIARKIAYVLCGGDLSYAQPVSEDYLLDLEREAFLSLCSEPRTLERIQYMLEHKKPLRN